MSSDKNIDEKDVLILLTTSIDSLKPSLPQAAIAVPSTLNRVGLSQVVAHLLGISSETEGNGATSSFEFTVTSQQFELLKRGKTSSRTSGSRGDEKDEEGRGEQGDVSVGDSGELVSRPLLRTSLRRYSRLIGLTSEDTLHLEFAPAIEAPKSGRGGAQGLAVRDWVSTLACGGTFAIAGLTDGTLSFAMENDLLLSSSSSSGSTSSLANVFSSLTIQGGGESNVILHHGGVTGVDICERSSFIGGNNSIIASNSSSSDVVAMVASAGKDCVVRLWNASIEKKKKKDSKNSDDTAEPLSHKTSTKGAQGGSSNAKASLQQQSSSSSSSSSSSGDVVSLSIVEELTGADDACGGVAFDPTGSFVACGDARGSLFLWDCVRKQQQQQQQGSTTSAATTATTGGSLKRPRSSPKNAVESTSSFSSFSSAPIVPLLPTIRLSAAHSGRVSDVCWLRAGQLASASWDHTVSVWDVEDALSSSSSSSSSSPSLSSSPVTTLRCGKVVTSITSSPLGGTLATGHADNTVRVWDPRGRGGSAGSQGGQQEAIGLRATLNGASTWVSDVAFHTTSGHHVAATTHGGLCLLWDIRAPQAPLYEVAKHSDKTLAVAWMQSGGGIISGGADSTVHVSTVSIGRK